MDNIPNDLIPYIFFNIPKISDKRLFLRTCKRINYITKQLMIQTENNFIIEYFGKISKYSVEKFTLELCNDSYFHLIPETYLYPNNKIIVQALATYGNVELLQKAFNNGCVLDDSQIIHDSIYVEKYSISSIKNTCALAAQNGHLNVIKFCLKNGCNLNWLSGLTAAKNGHIDILEWLKNNYCEIKNRLISSIASYNGHYETVN